MSGPKRSLYRCAPLNWVPSACPVAPADGKWGCSTGADLSAGIMAEISPERGCEVVHYQLLSVAQSQSMQSNHRKLQNSQVKPDQSLF